MYYGAVADAQAYFEGLSYEFPLQQNPADTLMDIVSGALLRPGQVLVCSGRALDVQWQPGATFAGGVCTAWPLLASAPQAVCLLTPKAIVSATCNTAAQASAAELCDAWEAHCGRPAGDSGTQQNGEGTGGQAVLTQRQGSIALRQAEGGGSGAAGGEDEAVEASDGSELLGGAEERRSWRRRLRWAGGYVPAWERLCSAPATLRISCAPLSNSVAIQLGHYRAAQRSSPPSCVMSTDCREAVLFGLAYIVAGTAEAWQSLKEALPQVEAPRWGARLFGRWRRDGGGFDGSLAGYTSGVLVAA